MLLFRQGVVGQAVEHSQLVLEEALKRTRAKYGPYRLEVVVETLVRERLLSEMAAGQTINTAVVATQPEWEDRLLPVRIPLDMGLSGYRIGLVRKDMQERVSAVRTVEDLHKLSMGVGLSWASRKILEAAGFTLETAPNQDQLTQMLIARRFDYFPRGVSEAFPEFDAKTGSMPDLAVERDLLVLIPLPSYIFVSPAAPRLAQRITDGLESMVRDGTLLRMVNNYYGDMLQRAHVCSRRILRIENPLLPPQTPLGRKELWFDPYLPRVGWCARNGGGAASSPARARNQTGKPSSRKDSRAGSGPSK